MNRRKFLRRAVGVALLPVLAKIPAPSVVTATRTAPVVLPPAIPAGCTTMRFSGGYLEPGDIFRILKTGESILLRYQLPDGSWIVQRGIGVVSPSIVHPGDEGLILATATYSGYALRPRFAPEDHKWLEDEMYPRSFKVAA